MKCRGKTRDGSLCSYTSETAYHFCPKCGNTPDEPVITVQCPGNGDQPCGEPIKSYFRFCPKCGWKSDKAMFTKKKVNKCPSCSADVPEGKKFCSSFGEGLFSIDDEKGPGCSKLGYLNRRSAIVMTPNQTLAVASTSQTSAVASTSQTPDVAYSRKTPSTASTSHTTTVSAHWTRKEPSSCEKVYELQQQVLSGELKLQALQTQKLLLQIKVLEMLEGKQVSEEMTPSQILMSLMQ